MQMNIVHARIKKKRNTLHSTLIHLNEEMKTKPVEVKNRQDKENRCVILRSFLGICAAIY